MYLSDVHLSVSIVESVLTSVFEVVDHWVGALDMLQDRLVNAGTGTGKTMVYLAPIINALQSYDPRLTRNDGTLGMWIISTLSLVMKLKPANLSFLRDYHKMF